MTDEIAFPSIKTMARLFDCSETQIEKLVKSGVIPPPMKLSSGCVRWDWAAVRAAMQAKGGIAAGNPDPYSVGARNATQETATKGGRVAS